MPEIWTDCDDRLANGCGTGPISDGEQVVRLLNLEMCPTPGLLKEATFPSDALRKPTVPSNACGSRDGESLLRLAGKAVTDFAVECEARFAGAKFGPAGVCLSKVEPIRALRPPHDQSLQLFYVYEDPNEGQPEHAVIRYTDDISAKSYFKLARRELLSLFMHQ